MTTRHLPDVQAPPLSGPVSTLSEDSIGPQTPGLCQQVATFVHGFPGKSAETVSIGLAIPYGEAFLLLRRLERGGYIRRQSPERTMMADSWWPLPNVWNPEDADAREAVPVRREATGPIYSLDARDG